jgi:hypothetical protein
MTYRKLRNPFTIALGQGRCDFIPVVQDEAQPQVGGNHLLQLVKSELKLTPPTAPPGWAPVRSPRGK